MSVRHVCLGLTRVNEMATRFLGGAEVDNTAGLLRKSLATRLMSGGMCTNWKLLLSLYKRDRRVAV